MKKRQVFEIAIATLILCCIIGIMKYKLQLQEAALAESVQAVEIEQEKIQAEIQKVRVQLKRADEQLYSYNLLLWEMRERLHLDLELELEE